jgi:uncharacterized MAPEG superfamily protein
MHEPIEMTAPLWGLVIFILWTIAIVVLLLVVRIQYLSVGGSAKDFGTPNDESLLWRLFRVQANLVENLPLYLGVVFLLTVRGVSGTGVNVLIGVYIAFRLVHSVIHVAALNPTLRLICLGIQLSCLIGLTALGVLT